MIHTYEVVPTAANARKMVRVAQIMNLTIDPIIHELAQLDFYDPAPLRSLLPESLQESLTEDRAEFIKYAHDSSYRCIVGGLTQIETFKNLYFAALASGVKPIVFHTQDDLDRLRAIVNFLNAHEIKHQVIDAQFHEIVEDVIVVQSKHLSHNLLRIARSGIVLHQAVDLNANKFVQVNPIEAIGIEFKRCVIGITVNQMSRAHAAYFAQIKGFKWWESQNFQDAFTALYPNSTMIKAFATDHTGTDNQLLKLGFILRSPEHFAKIMGIYMDLAKPLPLGI
jgi:hypothetical protein